MHNAAFVAVPECPVMRRLIPALLVIGVVFAVGYPLFDAVPATDDWGFMALARHIGSPWALYVADHSSSYFYRPNAMVLWWASVALFGPQAAAHYALNLGLHALNAMLVYALARSADVARALALMLALLFAAHPAAIGATAWLADRFDLTCTAACLAALWFLERHLRGQGRAWPVWLMALLAAGCKETGIALVPAVIVRVLLERDRPWQGRLLLVLGTMVPFMLMLAARATLLQPTAITTGMSAWVDTLIAGTGAWWGALPNALVPGWSLPNGPGLLALALATVLVALLAWRAWRGRVAPVTMGLIVLLFAPAVIQAPVAGAILAQAGTLNISVNFRFYYLALAALAALLAVTLGARDARHAHTAARSRPLLLAACTVLAAISGVAAYRQAQAWRANSHNTEHTYALEAARVLEAQVDLPSGCRIYLLGSATQAPGFFSFADAAVKALLPPGSPALQCAIVSERAPWFQLVRATTCADDTWLPLTPRTVPGTTLRTRPLGALCVYALAPPAQAEALADTQARFFAFDAQGRLHPVDREGAARAWIAP
jgi:hypothetical protein